MQIDPHAGNLPHTIWGTLHLLSIMAVVLVGNEANLVVASFLLAGVMAFPGLVFDSVYDVSLCCNCGFMGITVVFSRSFVDLAFA